MADNPGLSYLGPLQVNMSEYDPSKLLHSTPQVEFNASQHLAGLLNLIAPGSSPAQASVQKGGVKSFKSGGVWLLKLTGQTGWALKLVAAQRLIHKDLPTDVENCNSLVRKFPDLLSDEQLAFPYAYIRLENAGRPLGDLLVSHIMPGEVLARCAQGLTKGSPDEQNELEEVCEEVGEMLAEFHRRYTDPVSEKATHHRDFHPNNIFYDRSTGHLGIIDLNDMGRPGPKDDVDKFCTWMQDTVGERYASAFERSYINNAGHNHSFTSPAWLRCFCDVFSNQV
eukprot:gnl/MRDRNA2_/MRDRNA2_121936_c0_seq1.p1 gnl/MRDRNA2_/MRDRNA2_121936_c0~~gnl/MRDRNA2_/MRDRNA2_121936_c0_seq1.p1  ORF type:complete len:282 (+),score=58.07 gnl/MRDRNA2_/MRDRNA2_121936_c0_seq1:110-955(+)